MKLFSPSFSKGGEYLPDYYISWTEWLLISPDSLILNVFHLDKIHEQKIFKIDSLSAVIKLYYGI